MCATCGVQIALGFVNFNIVFFALSGELCQDDRSVSHRMFPVRVRDFSRVFPCAVSSRQNEEI